MSGKLIVVVGGQFGSEAKGHLVDQLSRPEREGAKVVGVRVAGPNAGHVVLGRCPEGCEHTEQDDYTWFTSEGNDGTGRLQRLHRWKLRAVPVTAVSNESSELIIAAGSEVDEDVLMHELFQLDSAGYRASSRLDVDAEATLLTADDIAEERESDLVKRLGSTAKGIGAARANRIWRTAPRFGKEAGMLDTAGHLYRRLREGWTVIIEGTQGFGLGLHAGMYPQCTSSDTRAIDFLAMAGISPWHPAVEELQVWVVARVRPIRVAGNSGPLKGETTWADLGLPVERTTVTNKIRRVGEWDGQLVARAVEANGGSHVNVALTMVDTVIPELQGCTLDIADEVDTKFGVQVTDDLVDLITKTSTEVGAHIGFIGTGPRTGFFMDDDQMEA